MGLNQIFFVRKFLLLQNHFLGNRFEPTIFIKFFFLVENFYCCKIISPGIGLNQKFSSTIFWSKYFYGCKIISSGIGLDKHFHRNFSVQIFYRCKRISLAIGIDRKFPTKTFWSKLFYDYKIISSGIGKNQKFSSKFFGRKFLWLQNHFLRIWF